MYVMCENNERYDCKTVRWIQKKKNVMHVNSNDACKNLVKYLKTKKISVLID